MKDAEKLTSPLYRSVRLLRNILPVAAFLLVLGHQALAQVWFGPAPWLPHFLWQVLLYGTVGPAIVWFALNWFAYWLRERDEAEAHLHCLHKISAQAATATDMEALVDIALRMPEEVIRPVAASLILREHPEGPWTLAGARGLPAKQAETLAARLAVAGSDLYCGQCAALSATAHENCPLQFDLHPADAAAIGSSVICLPLSTERPPLALLNVYLLREETPASRTRPEVTPSAYPPGVPSAALFGARRIPGLPWKVAPSAYPIASAALSPRTRRALESMAAVLSVALDHARLRAREFQMLQRMEQAARQQGGLAVTLEHILADMAEVYRARAAEVFLASREKEESTLTSLAAWPEKEIHPQFIAPAQQALGGDDLILTSLPTKEQVVAIPLRADGLTSGVLVLSGRHTFSASQQAFLRVAARVMALTISNSQLYAKLERQAVLEERNRLAREVHDGLAQSIGFLNVKVQHVERLIGREQWEGARQALCELREGIQHIYAEVRSTIQDLRWLPEDGRGLFKGLEQFVLDFGERTGLEVSLFLEGEPDLSPRDEVHLLRIVQEALANVHKHAQAQHAWVRLHAGLQGLRLEIEDDGRGMAPTLHSQAAALSDVRGHFGLRIMRERAEAMGGQLSLHSTPGQGTRVQVTVDWPAALVAQPLTMVSESN